MKRVIAFILGCILMLSQGISVFAENTEDFSKFEMMETDQNFTNGSENQVSPSLLYIADILTYIAKVSSNQVGIQGDVVCSTKVRSIKLTCTLQKKSGNKWVDAASKTTNTYDVDGTHKSYIISNVSSGTYRCKASVLVTDYNGYSESLTGYSSSINM